MLQNLSLYVPLKTLLLLFSLLFHATLYAEETRFCKRGGLWIEAVCTRLHQLWTEGDLELYGSGYAWHNRYTYTAHKVKSYNEFAAGGGLGKGFFDEDGDWHGLTAIAFLDSHKNLEPAAGYVFLKMIYPTEHIHLGGGYTILATSRPDIFNGIPFAGVLPIATVSYDRATVMATYIPGSRGAGNVLYIFGKWTL